MPKHPRRTDRVDKHQLVEVKIYREGVEYRIPSQMMDLSALGVGLLHPNKMEIGEQFSINIVQHDNTHLKLLYSVIYCNPDRHSGKFHVGGEFLCAVPLAA